MAKNYKDKSFKTLRARQTQRRQKEENINSRNEIENKHKIGLINKGISWPFEKINKHAIPLMKTDE